ncbi:hypothetical protein GB882_01125 [Georgenia ruanii]|uniref:Uncharacterized protein n=2 Tax=Georgenia ruanii TaxID=348442 RepID=A0A7J9USC9_9MICO|nr:hypothetical protein [Georgenia ruanii]
MTVVELPPQTILTTAPVDQAGLHELLARLTDFGIELLELGPAAGAGAAPPETTALATRAGADGLPEVTVAGGLGEVTVARGLDEVSVAGGAGAAPPSGQVAYEIHVGGAPSPAVLAALHQRATTVSGHLVVVVEAEAGSLSDVLRAIAVPGAEVESVRATPAPSRASPDVWRRPGEARSGPAEVTRQ